VTPDPVGRRQCDRCATELPASLLRCPACGTLVHAGLLTRLAEEATRAESGGDLNHALSRWNAALELLPSDAPQRAGVTSRIEAIDRQLHAASPAPPVPREKGLRGAVIAVATAVVFLLSKAKFLLLGLTKMGTLLSMVAFFGVYLGAYGWKFALGLVLVIYIHEMGHVASLRHYGIPASAPMFIPGLGALVRLKAHPPTAAQDARVGLAGPIWGTGAAIATFALFQLTHNGLFASLTHTGAVLNLFNLTPVWQLDGSRGIAPLTRSQRLILLAAAIASFALFHEGFLVVVALFLGVRCFTKDQGEGDQAVLIQFIMLLLSLGLLSTVRH
jgi:Zn-dependent protease